MVFFVFFFFLKLLLWFKKQGNVEACIKRPQPNPQPKMNQIQIHVTVVPQEISWRWLLCRIPDSDQSILPYLTILVVYFTYKLMRYQKSGSQSYNSKNNLLCNGDINHPYLIHHLQQHEQFDLVEYTLNCALYINWSLPWLHYIIRRLAWLAASHPLKILDLSYEEVTINFGHDSNGILIPTPNEDYSMPFEKNSQFMHLYRKKILSECIVLERNFGKYWKSI